MRTRAKMNRYPMSCHIIVEDEALYRADQKRMRKDNNKGSTEIKKSYGLQYRYPIPPERR